MLKNSLPFQNRKVNQKKKKLQKKVKSIFRECNVTIKFVSVTKKSKQVHRMIFKRFILNVSHIISVSVF